MHYIAALILAIIGFVVYKLATDVLYMSSLPGVLIIFGAVLYALIVLFLKTPKSTSAVKPKKQPRALAVVGFVLSLGGLVSILIFAFREPFGMFILIYAVPIIIIGLTLLGFARFMRAK